MRPERLVVAIALAMLFGASPARGDSVDEASKLYAQGSAAFDRGDYQIAAVAFEAALAKAPHARTAMSAALAWESAGDGPRSADLFARAVALGGLSSREAAEASRKLRALEAKLGTIDVDGEGAASVAHVDRRALPFTVHAAAGSWHVTFVAPDGTTSAADVDVAAGARVRVSAPPRVPAVVPPPVPPPVTLPPTRDEDPGAVQRGFGYATVALAGGATVACAVFGGLTLATRDDYEASGFTDVELHDRGTTFRTVTNVSLGAAAGLSIVGTILLVTAPHASSDGVAIDGRGLVVRFR